jgi:hypothetical protein
MAELFRLLNVINMIYKSKVVGEYTLHIQNHYSYENTEGPKRM